MNPTPNDDKSLLIMQKKKERKKEKWKNEEKENLNPICKWQLTLESNQLSIPQMLSPVMFETPDPVELVNYMQTMSKSS